MRIESIEMSWFRGAAAKAVLRAGSKSVVVYGDNACGKSSFVDAVEFIITKGKIEHLSNEYSDPENSVRNTETPDNEECTARICLENSNYVETKIPKTGRIRFDASQDDLLTTIQGWNVKRHILRQDEVSAFIHSTKTKKYSALTPLLGLQRYEDVSQNMLLIKEGVLKRSQYALLSGEFRAIKNGIERFFPTTDVKSVKNEVNARSSKYIQVSIDEPIDVIAKKAIASLETLLRDKEPQVKRYLVMQNLNKIQIKTKLESVIKSQDELGEISESYIDYKIPVLENTEKILASTEDLTKDIQCPACGQQILGTEFREHVNEELRSLEKAREARNQAVADKQDFITALSSFINQYKSEKSFLEWLSLRENRRINSLFVRLTEITIEQPRSRWPAELIENLKIITGKLCPIVEKEAKIEAPPVTAIVDDLSFFQECQKIPRFWYLEDCIEKIDFLSSALDLSHGKIREKIAHVTEQILQEISQDISRIWSLIHPGQPIEDIHLSPSEKEKAIDICLKFYGKPQSDPRLTLSEGYRNSLGLSIFLALANQGEAKDNPILLDDIVSSLDREHRGMVTQLLSAELTKRQVILFTHDREWFGELASVLNSENWKFYNLKKWESPKVGIELLPTTSTFDEAEKLISNHVSSSGNAVRAIMDTELPKAASKLKLAMPYLHGHQNDTRMAADFLDYFISQGERRFKIKDVAGWTVYQEAIDSWKETRKLLTWANRASHGGSLSVPEAKELIQSCKRALSFFTCSQCEKKVWALEAKDYVQCQCGSTRWKLE